MLFDERLPISEELIVHGFANCKHAHIQALQFAHILLVQNRHRLFAMATIRTPKNHHHARLRHRVHTHPLLRGGIRKHQIARLRTDQQRSFACGHIARFAPLILRFPFGARCSVRTGTDIALSHAHANGSQALRFHVLVFLDREGHDESSHLRRLAGPCDKAVQIRGDSIRLLRKANGQQRLEPVLKRGSVDDALIMQIGVVPIMVAETIRRSGAVHRTARCVHNRLGRFLFHADEHGGQRACVGLQQFVQRCTALRLLQGFGSFAINMEDRVLTTCQHT